MATAMIDLKRLGDVKAPAGFADRVLAQAGMADSYAVFDTVLGPVYVAWNRLGVSAAMRSKASAAFLAWFHKEVGRRLVLVDPPADLAAKIQDQLEGARRLIRRCCPRWTTSPASRPAGGARLLVLGHCNNSCTTSFTSRISALPRICAASSRITFP